MRNLLVLATSLILLACGQQSPENSNLQSDSKQYFNDDGEPCRWPYFGCWQLKQEILEVQNRYSGFPVWAADNQSLAGAEFKYLTKKNILNAPLQSIHETKDFSYRVFVQDSLASEKVLLHTSFKPGTIDKLSYMKKAEYVLIEGQDISQNSILGESKKVIRLGLDGSNKPLLKNGIFAQLTSIMSCLHPMVRKSPFSIALQTSLCYSKGSRLYQWHVPLNSLINSVTY